MRSPRDRTPVQRRARRDEGRTRPRSQVRSAREEVRERHAFVLHARPQRVRCQRSAGDPPVELPAVGEHARAPRRGAGAGRARGRRRQRPPRDARARGRRGHRREVPVRRGAGAAPARDAQRHLPPPAPDVARPSPQRVAEGPALLPRGARRDPAVRGGAHAARRVRTAGADRRRHRRRAPAPAWCGRARRDHRRRGPVDRSHASDRGTAEGPRRPVEDVRGGVDRGGEERPQDPRRVPQPPRRVPRRRGGGAPACRGGEARQDPRGGASRRGEAPRRGRARAGAPAPEARGRAGQGACPRRARGRAAGRDRGP